MASLQTAFGFSRASRRAGLKSRAGSIPPSVARLEEMECVRHHPRRIESFSNRSNNLPRFSELPRLRSRLSSQRRQSGYHSNMDRRSEVP